MSKMREGKTGKNPLHGNATLLAKIRETESFSGATKIHGSTCGVCLHFGECGQVQVKNVPENSRVCHWGVNRFERKFA